MFAPTLEGGFLQSSARAIAEALLRESGEEVLTFDQFIERVFCAFDRSGYHTKILISRLQDVADGRLTRLMVFIPSRHGKSELVSRLFTAYYIYRFRRRNIILSGYSDDFAAGHSDRARAYYRAVAGDEGLSPTERAKKRWATSEGGTVTASGRSGAIVGKGANLLILDDPLKNPDEAQSETIRQKVEDYYDGTLASRLETATEPDGTVVPEAIVFIMQRWAEDDLGGYLLDKEREEVEISEFGRPERWHVMRMPALKESPEVERAFAERHFPASCTLEPDERREGQALWPARYSAGWLMRQRRRMGGWFEAMFQQNPLPPGGALFEQSDFEIIESERVPASLAFRVVGADLATSTKVSADYTVGMPVGYSVQTGKYYLFKPFRDRVQAPDAETMIGERCKKFRAHVLFVEQVAYQQSFIQHMKRKHTVAGLAIRGVVADKDKLARASSWAPLAKDGLIHLVDDGSGWIGEFLDEATRFPKSKHDDQVDAVGVAIEGIRSMQSHSGAGAVGGDRKTMLPR